MTLWGRYGQSLKGHPQYDQAVTVGMNFSGDYWGRGKDAAGLSLGYLHASNDYRALSSTSTAAEQVAEAYYNWELVPKVVLTPDFQYIRHRGADSSNADTVVLGLRATLSM
jgi:carbohydrate-selective porin OprB